MEAESIILNREAVNKIHIIESINKNIKRLSCELLENIGALINCVNLEIEMHWKDIRNAGLSVIPITKSLD